MSPSLSADGMRRMVESAMELAQITTEDPHPAPTHADPLAETSGYPPLCAHGMNSLTDRGYDHALARLHRG